MQLSIVSATVTTVIRTVARAPLLPEANTDTRTRKQQQQQMLPGTVGDDGYSMMVVKNFGRLILKVDVAHQLYMLW